MLVGRLSHCLAATALAVAFHMPSAHADARSEELVRSFVNEVDGRPDWSASVARVLSEGDDTIVEDLVIRRDGEPLELRARRLRLSNLAPREGGGFRTARAAVTGVSFSTPNVRLEAPDATGSDLAFPNLLDAPFDPERPALSIARLYGLAAQSEIGSLAVPRLTTEEPGGPGAEAGARTTQEDMLVTGLRNGVLERLSVGPTTIVTRDATGETRIVVGSVEGLRYDLDAVAHVLDPDRYAGGRGDGVWREAIGSFAYRDITVTAPDSPTVSISRIGLSGFGVRQPDEPFLPVIDRLAANPDMPEEEATRLGLQLLGLFGAIRIGEMGIEGVAVPGPAGGGLERFAVQDVSAEGIGAIRLEGVRISAPDATFGLGKFEVADIGFPGGDTLNELIALSQQAEAVAAPDPAMQARLARLGLSMMPTIGRIVLSDLSAGLPGADSVRLASYTAEMRDYVGLIPRASTARLEGLVIPGALLRTTPEAAAIFDGLGYDRLAIGAEGTGEYEPQSGRTATRTTLTVEEAGALELAYALSGITPAWVDRVIELSANAPPDDPTFLLPLMSELRLESVALRLTDLSLVDRAIRFAAQAQGLEPDMYRAQLQGAVPFMMTQSVPFPDLQLALTDAVQGFLAGGRTLVVELKPVAPVSVAAILEAAQTAPETLPDLLGVRIGTTP